MLKLNELKKKLNGVNVVLITPFKENGEVNYEGMKENVRFLMEKFAGKECFFTPCGSSGEFTSLTKEENQKIIEMVVKEVNGKFPVVAGTGEAGTMKAVEMAKFAQSVGADGLQIILPYYFVPTEEGMYQHYKAIAEAVDIGILIYNNPAFSQSWIKPHLMLKLSQFANIVGVKENTPHFMLGEQMIKTLKESTDMAFFCGFGEKWYAYQFMLGVNGFVSSIANFAPDLSYKLYEAGKNYDVKGVRNVMNTFEPWFKFVGKVAAFHGPDTGIASKPGGSIYGEGNVRFAAIKEAVSAIGLHGGTVRLPLVGITDQERAELKTVLKEMKLI